ncbi:unnamed protein product [Thelazia callipaeda]|uniref:SAP domain-containing protein n=1 Tax=Thelazia callipaeda TaxID=103827 RepID=A0A0N5D3X2_THECL|nr:unnamed protein product [Thelazia callipaeda]
MIDVSDAREYNRRYDKQNIYNLLNEQENEFEYKLKKQESNQKQTNISSVQSFRNATTTSKISDQMITKSLETKDSIITQKPSAITSINAISSTIKSTQPISQQQLSKAVNMKKQIELSQSTTATPVKNLKNNRESIGLVAYGIYRSRPYYTPLERRFRTQNGYDDGYLIKIFQDYDYVILTQLLDTNSFDPWSIRAPSGSNVVIMNEKYLNGGTGGIQLISIDKLRTLLRNRHLHNRKAEYIVEEMRLLNDYPTKKFPIRS